MILHCVFLRFKAVVTADEKQDIYDALGAMKQDIAGILDIKSGPNVSPEGLNGGFVDGFIISLADIESRDALLSHPLQEELADRLMPMTDGGVSGIMVFEMVV